jgi:hypothetical protein
MELITLCSDHFTLWEGDPVPIEQQVGWVQELVHMFFKKRKLLVPTRIQTGPCPGHSLASILTRQSWFPMDINNTHFVLGYKNYPTQSTTSFFFIVAIKGLIKFKAT